MFDENCLKKLLLQPEDDLDKTHGTDLKAKIDVKKQDMFDEE